MGIASPLTERRGEFDYIKLGACVCLTKWANEGKCIKRIYGELIKIFLCRKPFWLTAWKYKDIGASRPSRFSLALTVSSLGTSPSFEQPLCLQHTLLQQKYSQPAI